ncbi:hypothetical protein AB0910_06465 [Streptomyces sp. NPDC047002]|uniref:hypothetical protein n=1 Tax=Streptomyces sp. NPDC047002 TaxID=3155475 RepID=UPI0034521A8D
MDQKLDSGAKRHDGGAHPGEEGAERRGRRLDLSVPQVAGSALAAVAAAVLASQLDVYGTIIGAGVVSVIATCGGSIFHYLFRRTGERIKDVAEQTRPRGRQIPAQAAGPDSRGGLPDTLDVLGADYGEATSHGSRRRGWKRPVLGAVVVFLLAMVCITGYELAAGHDLGGNARTTIGSVVSGGGSGGRSPSPATPSTGDSGKPDKSAGTGQGGSTEPGGASTSPSPGSGRGEGRGSTSPGGRTPSPGTTPSGGTGQSPAAPTPSPSTGDGGDGASAPAEAPEGAGAPSGG